MTQAYYDGNYRLDLLEWSPMGHEHRNIRRADIRSDLCILERSDGTYFVNCSSMPRGIWEDLDAVGAQCVLFYLEEEYRERQNHNT
jgi:hypothetical protein